MYNALTLSKYIVTKCVNDGYPISNLQLQKILYFIQKDFLTRGSIAFSDDIEAWQFGPVVPNTYYRFCGFGAMPITDTYPNTSESITPDDRQIVDSIVESKRVLRPWDLVSQTHSPDGAWAKTFKNGVGNRAVISPELISSED